MVDWNDLKKAFERELNKVENEFVSNEQTLLQSIAAYMAAKKGTTSIQAYNTEEILDFLQMSADEIKETLGGEWAGMDNSQLEPLIYSLTKKVKKSSSFLG